MATKRTGSVPHGQDESSKAASINLTTAGSHTLNWTWQNLTPDVYWRIDASTDGNDPWFYNGSRNAAITTYDISGYEGSFWKVSRQHTGIGPAIPPSSNVVAL